MIKISKKQDNVRMRLTKIFCRAIREIAPKKLLRGCLKGAKLNHYRRIAIISIGKAAQGMLGAIAREMPRKPYKTLCADIGHPLPTRKSLENTRKILRLAQKLGENDLAIVLISGGGSSMFELPIKGISLQDEINITRALLKSRATIDELNVVRKHISAVKGGRLAKLLYPASVLGFVISDVVGSDLQTIASGPISPDRSTFSDALKILKKYRIKAHQRVIQYLKQGTHDKTMETPKPGEECLKHVTIKILADHETTIHAAQRIAGKMGFKIRVINKRITGEAKIAGRKILQESKAGMLVLASGETTVHCLGQGHGGRNQEFVLGALERLKKGQTILSGGTDGVDGLCPENIAGAVADFMTKETAQTKGLHLQAFLKNNDSYGFFHRVGGLIRTGPTGTNLGDLILLYQERV